MKRALSNFIKNPILFACLHPNFPDQNGNKVFRIAVFRDLCSAFGAPIQPHLEKQTILELLQEGRRSKGGKTKNVATWATKELRKLKV